MECSRKKEVEMCCEEMKKMQHSFDELLVFEYAGIDEIDWRIKGIFQHNGRKAAVVISPISGQDARESASLAMQEANWHVADFVRRNPGDSK
jgi:hypothetical protein